jgi:serine/threonine-protein kinase
VKLLDFGLAKHFPTSDEEGQGTDDVTSAGVIAGTTHYMAPERFWSTQSVDYRCDLFSVGAVIYQMATGAKPFDGLPKHALMSAITDDPHVPLRQLAPQHPDQLERLVDRLLAKRPADRYQSARELRADLDAIRATTLRPAATPHRNAVPSVAIVPFEIIGPATADVLEFRDGLAEDLRRAVSGLGLRVASRTATLALTEMSARKVGEVLGVRTVLEGTVRRNHDRVRVTASLVETLTAQSLGPIAKIDRVCTDSLAAQDDVADEVCRVLAPHLRSNREQGPTVDPDAHHALKRALYYWRSCYAGGWRPALEHLQYAIDRDPGYAAAHLAIANAYNFLGFYSLIKPTLAFDVAARAAARAAAIDPSLASAYRELAVAKFGGEWDWDGAEDNFRRALALDAADPLAHVHYSWLLILLGRVDAALAEAHQGHALAPSSRLVTAARAQTLYIGGLFDQAIDVCNECLRLDQDYVFALHLRGLCYLALGRDAAIADLERAATLASRAPFYIALLGRCYGQFGMRDEAVHLIRELQAMPPTAYVPPQCYVFIYAGLGEAQRALEYQEEAYEDGASPFNYFSPSLRNLYALDPYHKERLRQMRLIV